MEKSKKGVELAQETDQENLNLSCTQCSEHSFQAGQIELHKSGTESSILMEGIYKDLMPSNTVVNALRASQLTMFESMKPYTSIAQKFKELMPSSSAINALRASQLTMLESMKPYTSIAERYKDLMPSNTMVNALRASQLTMLESMKPYTSIAERYKDLMPSNTMVNALRASQLAMLESMKPYTSIAEKFKEVMPSSSAINVLRASQLTMLESMKPYTSIAEKFKEVMPSSSVINALRASQLATFESMKPYTSIVEKYKDLMPSSMATSDLVRSWVLGKNELISIKELYKSAGSYLDSINSDDLMSIVDIANRYTNTAEGAAYIAQNNDKIREFEPDAIVKFEEFKNKNVYVQKFRELPLQYQLIIIYFVFNIFAPIVNDLIKTKVLDVFNEAGNFIVSSLPVNAFTKELITYKDETIDWDVLKDFRIITADNVRLRDNPSMKGEVIETLEKYSVVAVLDRSNRKWIYVKVSIGNEQICGWVNRSYTKPLKRY
ncbi:TPA: SH3 domain-containing protein [Proteus mirabilis]